MLHTSHGWNYIIHIMGNGSFTPSELQVLHCGIAWFTPWELHGGSQCERFPEPKTVAIDYSINEISCRSVWRELSCKLTVFPPGPWQSQEVQKRMGDMRKTTRQWLPDFTYGHLSRRVEERNLVFIGRWKCHFLQCIGHPKNSTSLSVEEEPPRTHLFGDYSWPSWP